MTDEQDIGTGSEHFRFERKDCTAESTAEDSVVAGDQKQDHQQRHQEMKVSGSTFQGMNKLYQHETGNQVNDGSGTLTDESVTIVALNPDGSEVKASGKTGLSENDLEQAALTTRSRHGHTINPTETMPAQAYDPTHETTLPIEQNLESALLEKYHHGEPLTLSEFLQLPKGVSPVVDAYRSSLAKLNGEPGKSPTLERSIFRLQNCPWADEIKIVYNNDIGRKDYDPNTKTIEIGGQLDDGRKIETFAHEAYHATHRGFFKLYLDPNLNGQPASLDDFLNVRFGDEVRAFIEEIKVNNELTSKFYGAKPVTMMVIEKGGIGLLPPIPFFDKDVIDRPNLNTLYAKDGLSEVWRFLREGKPPQTTSNDEPIKDGGQSFKSHDTYDQRYRKQYEWYQNTFAQQVLIAQQTLIKFIRFHHTPAQFEDWGY